MKIAYKNAKEFNSDISQVSVSYMDKDQKVLIANTEGIYTEDRRVRTRLAISAVASKDNENQTGFEVQEHIKDLKSLMILIQLIMVKKQQEQPIQCFMLRIVSW
jgi:predicted Zn-dependent protease